MLHRTGHGLPLRTEFGARPNLGASACSVGDGSAGRSSKRYLDNASVMGGSNPGRSRGGLTGREAATMSAAGKKTGAGRSENKVGGEEDDGVEEVAVFTSASTSSSASASAQRTAPESASAFVLVSEPASAPADQEEKGGVCRAPVKARDRHATAAVQSQGGSDVGGESARSAMHGRGINRRFGPGEGKRQEEGPEEKEKTAATMIEEVLGRLPLSKLKIVIGERVVYGLQVTIECLREVSAPKSNLLPPPLPSSVSDRRLDHFFFMWEREHNDVKSFLGGGQRRARADAGVGMIHQSPFVCAR